MNDWKDIKGYEGLYKINKVGQVISFHSGKEKIMKTRINNYGYYIIDLRKDKQRKTYKIHRLVAETFIDNPLNRNIVDHINRIKTDNRVENLRWVTSQENNLNK